MNIKIHENCRLSSAIRWAVRVNGIIDYNEETIAVDENLSVVDVNNEALQLGMELVIPCTNPAGYVLKLCDATNGLSRSV